MSKIGAGGGGGVVVGVTTLGGGRRGGGSGSVAGCGGCDVGTLAKCGGQVRLGKVGGCCGFQPRKRSRRLEIAVSWP